MNGKKLGRAELREVRAGGGRWGPTIALAERVLSTVAGGRRGRGGPGAGRGGAGADPRADPARLSRGRADRASAAAGPAGGRAAASMVLVLHHILIAVVQFLRRGQQVFLKPDEPPPPPPQPCADSLQVGGPPRTGREENGVSCEPGPVRGACGYWPLGPPAPAPSSVPNPTPGPGLQSLSRALGPPARSPIPKQTLKPFCPGLHPQP